MDATIPCPECGRKTRVPEVHLGKRFKCPGCGAVVSSKRPEASELYAPPQASIGPAGGRDSAEDQIRDGSTWHFHVKVKRDPSQALKGVFKVEVAPRGLVLRVPKKETEVARVRVGTPARYEGGATIAIEIDGREVTLVLQQMGLYTHRLAEDLVAWLGRDRGRPVAEEYAMPKALMVAAYLPIGVGFIGMSGGAIGGGIGGGIAGSLMAANLAIIRKESMSVAARLTSCLAISLVGYVALVIAFVAIATHLRGDNPPPLAPPRFGPVATNPPVAAPPPSAVAEVAEVAEPKTPPAATGMEGLAGYWPFEEGSGSNATDASGRGHEGTLTNGKWVEGIRGSAVRFDGDGFLDYGDSPEFNFAKGESFTMAGWFRSPEGKGPLISHRNTKDGSPVIDIILEGGAVTATVREDGNETLFVGKVMSKPIRDDHWHHFALVRHGGEEIELFLDGESQQKVAGMNTGGSITSDLRSAGSERYWVKTSWPAPHYLQGAIDELCVFRRDLKAEEVRSLAGR